MVPVNVYAFAVLLTPQILGFTSGYILIFLMATPQNLTRLHAQASGSPGDPCKLTVMRSAFADAALVEQVVYELGADSNSGSARLATAADGPVEMGIEFLKNAAACGVVCLVLLSSGTPEASGEGSDDVSGADPEIRWWRLCPWTTATAVSRLTNQPKIHRQSECVATPIQKYTRIIVNQQMLFIFSFIAVTSYNNEIWPPSYIGIIAFITVSWAITVGVSSPT